MSRQTQRKGWFSWRLRSLFLAVLIYYLVSRDIKEHNGFESKSITFKVDFLAWKHVSFSESKTGLFLKDIGLDECAKSSYNYVVQRVEQVTKWGDANVPVVRQKANQLWDLSLPYIDKANVLVGQGTTWMTEKSNLALEKVGSNCHDGFQIMMNFSMTGWSIHPRFQGEALCGLARSQECLFYWPWLCGSVVQSGSDLCRGRGQSSLCLHCPACPATDWVSLNSFLAFFIQSFWRFIIPR